MSNDEFQLISTIIDKVSTTGILTIGIYYLWRGLNKLLVMYHDDLEAYIKFLQEHLDFEDKTNEEK